ncbi:efflux RND transporter permease subunit [Craterilacuibacter sp. RT1T]|uniref:efflux RND transporter permease subunit n=1 Tax=Craterilacuibacter sp. RT1T TaxID=2942211 RepID=UPI0020BFECE7|nr:efflux RND transporter permease subunit [Craterilacuibacter sp. RT1T]MCL6263256.1 efflux RND transporter permease subunit [Craterilacuibacter sp. RT1T]
MNHPSKNNALRRMVDACSELLFRHRNTLLLLFAAVTLALGWGASQARLDPGFNKLIPLSHPYMQTLSDYSKVFSGANRILVNVRVKDGSDIYNKPYMDALKRINDEIFFIPGVDRTRVRSLYSPTVRYTEVTEEGFLSDVVVPARFTAQADELAVVQRNAARSGEIGRLIATDQKGSMIVADLQDINPDTGKKVDYAEIAQQLEQIRSKYGNDKIEINIIGFAKVVGDVQEALGQVFTFFGIAFAITALLLLAYSRSIKLTVVALLVALLPVVWLVGLLPVFGLGIDPMSILVPFLIFSIGVSHAVQMTNAWKQEVIGGKDAREAAKAAFRKLFVPGSVALLTNALGFMVIMLIDIQIVRELGATACLGVTLMIVTNKMLLPLVLSFLKLEPAAMHKAAAGKGERHAWWWRLSGYATARPALFSIFVGMLLLGWGTLESRKLEVGDTGSGVAELRADSRYNLDHKQIVGSYAIGMDVLTVIVESKTDMAEGSCLSYPLMNAVDRFSLQMQGVSGVQSVVGVPTQVKFTIAGQNEGNPRWAGIPQTSEALRQGARAMGPEGGLSVNDCHAMQILVYLKDHKGATLANVMTEAKRFIADNQTPGVKFRLAGGSAGVAAATNEAVEHAEVTMLLSIFGAISLLCLLTFRSWRAVLCIVVPLALVSILCNALMAQLGIGLKVSTLPVIALGVGVDYGIYLFERIETEMQERGLDLREAVYEALRQRGTAAVFTAFTMALSVGTWAFSSLKFQADMGILLAFMFFVNVFGAITLAPALAYWLNLSVWQRKTENTMSATKAQTEQAA